MTDPVRLSARLGEGRRRYLAHLATAGVLRFLALAALFLFALVALGALLARVPEAPYALAALALGGLVTGLGLLVARPLAVAPGLKPYALLAEERFPEARSLLVNGLELAPSGNALAQALVHEARVRADGLALQDLAPSALPRRWALVLGGAVALWGLGFGLFPGPLGASFDRLLHPRAAAATLIKVSVEPGDVTVPPGATLEVRARVDGTTRRPTLVFARAGEKNQRVGMDRLDDRWVGSVRGIAAPGSYWVEVSGVRSPLYAVALSGQAGIVSFDLTYAYPSYTRLPAETQSVTRGDVTARSGTQVTVVVNLDRHAKGMRWTLPGGATEELTALSPRRFQGKFVVRGDGAYTLVATTAKETIRETYRITALPDQPPLLTVIQPEGDLDLPEGQKIPVWAAGTDDFGLTRLTLVAQNEKGAVVRVPLAQWPDQPRDASAGVDWDASNLALLPGQSATFHLELADNGPNVTVSRTFTLRFPLLSELYKTLENEHDSTTATLEQTARDQKELAKQVEELAKSLQNDRQVDWEKQQAAKDAAEKQKQLADQVSKAAQALEERAQSAEEHKAYEDQLLAKMQELSKLVAELQNEDMKRSLDELSKKVSEMDPRQLQQQLKDLAQQQKETLAGLERSIDLMKKLRQEEKAHEAAERAKELADRQERLNKEMTNKPPDSKSQAQQLGDEQQKLEAEAQDLAKDLEQLAKDLEQQASQGKSQPKAGEQKPMEQGAKQLEQQIAPQMDQAEQNMRQSQGNQGAQQKAQKSGKQAQQGLEQLSESLSKAASSMSNEDNQAVAQAIRRSAQDLVNLSQAGEQALDKPGTDNEKAQSQEDLQQGASQVVDDLINTGKDTPYLGPEATKQLGRAINELQSSKDAYAQGNAARGKQAGERAGEAIDQAVIALRQAEAACQKPGPGKGGKQGGNSREKMQGLANEQGDLNQESQSLADKLTKQQRLASGDQASLERLAAQQQRIREGLEEAMNNAKPGDNLLGRMDQAKDDMNAVEQNLKKGRLDDETLARQQKILSRMLDAQRSLNKRDFDDQRESHAGRDAFRPTPAALRAELLKREDRVRSDLLRAQAEKYPGEYRSLVEAYLRRLGANE
jgi:hypothetical protein